MDDETLVIMDYCKDLFSVLSLGIFWFLSHRETYEPTQSMRWDRVMFHDSNGGFTIMMYTAWTAMGWVMDVSLSKKYVEDSLIFVQFELENADSLHVFYVFNLQICIQSNSCVPPEMAGKEQRIWLDSWGGWAVEALMQPTYGGFLK